MEITRTWVCLRRTDYFLTVSAYPSHLVMPFSHNQKLQCWGGIISPCSLPSCSHLPCLGSHPPPSFTAPDDRKYLSIHFEKQKERGDLHSSRTPYFISLEYKYTLWEMVQERKTSPWRGLVYSNTKIPSVVTDEFAVGASPIALHTRSSQAHAKVSSCAHLSLPQYPPTRMCLDCVLGR